MHRGVRDKHNFNSSICLALILEFLVKLTLTFDFGGGDWTHHVALGGVHGLREALQGHPFNGNTDVGFLSVVVTAVDLFGQSKIGHTHSEGIAEPGIAEPVTERMKMCFMSHLF